MEDNKEDNKIRTSGAPQPEEQEIDLLELAARVWAERKLVLKWCGVAVVVGLVVAFSIPKEYTTTVTLAPETSQGGGALGGLSAPWRASTCAAGRRAATP